MGVPFWSTLWANFPLFMVFFVLLFVIRLLLDLLLPGSAAVVSASNVVKYIIKGIMVTVCAAIGLRLRMRTLFASWRYVVTECVSSVTLSTLSLAALKIYSMRADDSVLRATGSAAGLVFAVFLLL